MQNIIINEDLARRAKENISFSDYKQGSATAEYRAAVAEVAARIENAKTKVSPEAQAKLDRLLQSYSARYAAWINKSNANGANHVSVMISGPSGFNMNRHNKYLARESKLWEEYEEFKNIYNRIDSIVAGDKIIKSSDTDAIEKLQAKVDKLESQQENMKAANKIVKSKKLTDAEKVEQLVNLLHINTGSASKLLQGDFCGRVGFPSYMLTNNNATIRTAKKRIEQLTRQRQQETKEIIIETAEPETEGVRIVDNVEACRLQIFFPGKPDAAIRAELKKNGFRWAPSIGAWQSYRSERATEIAQRIAKTAF